MGLSDIAQNSFLHSTEDDGNTFDIDGRLLASDEFAHVSGNWNAPPDLSALPGTDASAAVNFVSIVFSHFQSAEKA